MDSRGGHGTDAQHSTVPKTELGEGEAGQLFFVDRYVRRLTQSARRQTSTRKTSGQRYREQHKACCRTVRASHDFYQRSFLMELIAGVVIHSKNLTMRTSSSVTAAIRRVQSPRYQVKPWIRWMFGMKIPVSLINDHDNRSTCRATLLFCCDACWMRKVHQYNPDLIKWHRDPAFAQQGQKSSALSFI